MLPADVPLCVRQDGFLISTIEKIHRQYIHTAVLKRTAQLSQHIYNSYNKLKYNVLVNRHTWQFEALSRLKALFMNLGTSYRDNWTP